MKKLSFYSLFMAVIFACSVACGTKQTASEREEIAANIRNGVEAHDFTFSATYAYPTGFKSMYLSPYYDVKVSPDTVRAYLPYYGRAYRAPMNPSESGFKFTSTDFDYRVEQGRRAGNWLVSIKMNDVGREVIFNFDIWENGSARLNVTDIDRQPISFQGDIK